MRRLIGLGLCLLIGCSPSSMDDFQKEGKAHCERLVKHLETVETTDQLQELMPRLKKEFQALVKLIIEARKFQDIHPDDDVAEVSFAVAEANETLIFELERIYQLERGREIVERAQRDALHRLDAFEKRRKKKQQRLPTSA